MSKNISATFLIMIIITIAGCILLCPVDNNYVKEYIFLSICLVIYLIVNFICFLYFGIYIFEPIIIIFILYLFMFFIDPMMNIINGETDVMGFEVMDGCINATSIFMLSYFGLMFGYYINFNSNNSYHSILYRNNSNNLTWDNAMIEKIAFVIWFFSFCFGCIELLSKGMSINYFLTLGLSGGIEDITATSAFGFLGNFRFSMITAWVYLFVCNKKSLKTKLCGVLTLEYFILRGFRHSLFVVIFAPIIYIYISKKKSPSKKVIISMIVMIIIVMGIMQFVRGALRSGTSIEWSSFEKDIFVDAIQGNFDVYKTFYGMVVAVPDQLNYQWGMCSIVSVITMCIPRAIWPYKPVSPIITNLDLFCGSLAAESGYAMPNISEYYLDFGIIGCAICLFIFGIVLKKLKYIIKYKNSDKHSLILYSVIFPALLQVVLRGYSPSYMYLILFYLFPIIIIKILGGLICKKRL